MKVNFEWFINENICSNWMVCLRTKPFCWAHSKAQYRHLMWHRLRIMRLSICAPCDSTGSDSRRTPVSPSCRSHFSSIRHWLKQWTQSHSTRSWSILLMNCFWKHLTCLCSGKIVKKLIINRFQIEINFFHFSFYPNLYFENFTVCFEFPSQLRFSIAFPLICSHFMSTTHELCPEEVIDLFLQN